MTAATSSERASELARRDRNSSFLDKLLFFGVFIAGTVSVVILKQRGINQYIVTAIPVGLMFFYLFCTLWTQRYVLSADRAGDNIYYMGFLYTLVSIAYSLYEFTTSEGSAQKIITNFGIALATTIVGLALRVTLMQARGDPSEVERIARMELSEAASNLKAELHAALSAISGMQLASQQSISDTAGKAKQQLDEALSNATSRFSAVANEISAHTQAAFKAVQENSTALTKSSSKLVSASEKIALKLDAVSVPSDILERKLSGVVGNLDQKLGEAADRFHKATTALEQITIAEAASGNSLSTASRAVADHAESLKAAAELLQGHVQGLSELGPGMRELAGLLANLSLSFQRNQQVLTEMVRTTEADLNSIKAQREQIREEVQQATALLLELESNLVGLTRGIVDRLNA